MANNSQFTIYIEKMWVEGEFDFYPIQNYFERVQAKGKIAKKRREFIEKLKKEGFQITFNKEDITEDTICFIMDDTSLCDTNTSIEEYKQLFDEKIRENAGENFYYPFSMRVEEYMNQPFFPAVFKNELTNGGQDKFLIEKKEQLDIMRQFYEKYYSDYQEDFDNSIFQQYLETPSKYATYLRVLVGGSGEVMGAGLKYSARAVGKGPLNGKFEKIFLDSNSEYFIDAPKMFNYYSGGQNISFSQPKYSAEKTKILEEHGFDTEKLELPAGVLDVCCHIMQNLNREIGVLCGIDFMLNKKDGKWYYLENQAFPAIEEWADAKRITLPSSHKINGYLKYLEFELQARKEALDMLVHKRSKETEDGKSLVLKK